MCIHQIFHKYSKEWKSQFLREWSIGYLQTFSHKINVLHLIEHLNRSYSINILGRVWLQRATGTGTSPGSDSQCGNNTFLVHSDLLPLDSLGTTPGSGQHLIHYIFRHMPGPAQHPWWCWTNLSHRTESSLKFRKMLIFPDRAVGADDRDETEHIAEIISFLKFGQEVSL